MKTSLIIAVTHNFSSCEIIYFTHSLVFFPIYGYITNSQCDQFPVVLTSSETQGQLVGAGGNKSGKKRKGRRFTSWLDSSVGRTLHWHRYDIIMIYSLVKQSFLSRAYQLFEHRVDLNDC